MSDLDDIRQGLADRADELARELVPDGRRSGHYWIGRCPWRGDRHAGSFWVNLAGAKRPGTWKDAATDEKGGPLDLVMRACNLDFKGALDWSREFLGLARGGVSDDERRRRRAEAERRRAAADAAYEAETADKRRRAASLFRGAKRLAFRGSPADAYLRGARGIDVGGLGRLPGVLGHLPDCRHVESGRRVPALVALIQQPMTRVALGVHMTFLEPTGADKLRAPPGWPPSQKFPVRKVWPGGIAGGVIRLWRGDTGMAEDEAAACGAVDELALCEGVEDGLSIALALPRLRVWCAYSLSNLVNVRLPPCAERVTVFADNDWGKPRARAALDTALAALERQGRPVAVAHSHIGKDVNDALRG